ncbi:phosphotransferase [Agromyces mediolanus]|uniref:Phosphotransferase n=1 Tax=Agromyces mediolanus TaxID=41986 RepID=A0A918FBH3_AGRME|nr:aminoglycoside 3'-phosphotransferase [Agromyces mediolanus]GGR24023.1 putative phosphotransferase [Agromyces mediolanus]GLJ71013.1 putative phosphotransferase [Agromyces mediolanus]
MGEPELAGQRPEAEVVRPAKVLELAAGRPTTPLWRNEAGGLTFRIEGERASVVKWNPPGSGESLADEAERLRWLAGRLPAPQVLEVGADASGEWLLSEAIPARSAVDERWLAEPGAAVRAIAEGLRRLHALELADCPYDWGVAHRLDVLRRDGLPVPAELRDPPPVEPVVCHGDPCAPNTLLGDDGRFAAIVDAARLGVADRWADLAVASLSLDWNYGPGWQPTFFAAYGVEPDEPRLAYYRALWDAE